MTPGDLSRTGRPFWADAPATQTETHHGRQVQCFADRPPSIDSMLRDVARHHGTREAVVDGDVRIDHATLDQLTEDFAAFLTQAGIRPGDRVLLLTANRWPFIVALLGILRCGAIAVPLGIRMSASEVGHIAEDCAASLAVVDDDLTSLLPTKMDRILASSIAVTAASVSPADHIAEEDDTAIILYTSGTTGRPKGAMLTHLNLIHSCLHYAHSLELNANDRFVMAVPASHVTGLVATILAPLAVGAAVIVMESFDANRFLQLAARERMTCTILVPAMYNLCLLRSSFPDHDLSRWRIGAFGGAPMPVVTMERLTAVLPNLKLVQAYGSTETASPATIMPPGRQMDAPPSVGAPVACADIRVMDETGREVAHGTSGEIWIGGPMVSPGYWNDPERTAAGFPDGFWRSGDIGRFDENGLLYVHDRIKDMINRGGYKVWSAEVEDALGRHPAVAEAAVVGRPDPVLGEKTHAVVRLKDAARETGATLDEEELRAHCRGLLADYKVPDTFAFWNEPLPRNANGKLMKGTLRDALV
ncbi:AMP-binding protein [Rhizobiaceae bacterium]|nr:AMP-binding protein [Rhizobiaceae bacterium]